MKRNGLKKVLVILGSTSTGKTDLGLDLAKKFNGEIISCDSRQVYKGLDIGTGKLPGKPVKVKKGKRFWQMDGIKVWMYDVAAPNTRYDVYQYLKDAEKAIKKIEDLGKLPIILGGTGLYFKALTGGLSNLKVPVNQKLRQRLEKLPLGKLQEKLKKLSLVKWKRLNNSDRLNKRRLIRHIELHVMSPMSKRVQSFSLKVENYNILKIGLHVPKEILNQKIDERVESRIKQGMIQEAQDLAKRGLSLERMQELGLEYGVLAEFLEGKLDQEELVFKLKTKIRQYAKRQITWFKKEKDVFWFDISGKGFPKKVEKLTSDWYNQADDKTG